MQQVLHLLDKADTYCKLSLPTSCLKWFHTLDFPPNLLKVNSPVFVFFSTTSSSIVRLKWNSRQKATEALFAIEYESNLCVKA